MVSQEQRGSDNYLAQKKSEDNTVGKIIHGTILFMGTLKIAAHANSTTMGNHLVWLKVRAQSTI